MRPWLYKKKPVVIEATKLTAEMAVQTLEGVMTGKPGDWLIIGVQGEPYFCQDEIFWKTYEPCDDEDAQPTRFVQARKHKPRVRPIKQEEDAWTPNGAARAAEK